MKVIMTLVKKAALPVIGLALTASAAGCVTHSEAQADHREPAKAETAYYHNQVGNSDNDIETYDRWRQLFGS
jgi:outer membrane PBP1 activator LpoA protein